MEHLFLYIVSIFAGVWNVINEKFQSYRRSVGLFLLGASFCYCSAIIAETYGLESQTATCIGYICGMLSPKIYDAMAKIVSFIPNVVMRAFEKWLEK
ncbi:MAG: hypothetical protein KBT03_13700 [Bacteroidales bacterium]|nr:hypothetical protein [Candidatus Scybalousia scybalohippi]